ncbi:MAG: ATP synthase F1 subunit delta [Oscillospiraceae bacterium]|nr:ATP synthase F1 subunit delta [Oscillospiraceae bacterium]
MSGLAKNYGSALYSAAMGENLTEQVYNELCELEKAFSEKPQYLRLLSAANVAKEERLKLVDDCLGGKVHPYVLNFMKLLAEKSIATHFGDCVKAYRERYYFDNGIMPVTAVTAVPLSDSQYKRLSEKIASISGKKIILTNKVDPSCLGGVKLSYDSKQIDGTVSHRLKEVSELLKLDASKAMT